jgi:alpha-mannosidase
VYINLFNNQWSTNFRLWNAGTWSSRVRLWSVNGGDAEKNLVTPSEEARCPLGGIAADGPAGTLPAQQTGLQISKRGVKVTAFFPDSDGKGLILRLWELAGRSGDCQVRLPAGIKAKQAQPLDLRDNPIGAPIQIRSDKFEVPIWEFAPASFRVETGTE